MKLGIKPMHDEHINVTPLIDVVMCLIIFFMVCGKMAQAESEGGVKVPVAKLGQELPGQRDRIVINLVPQVESNAGTMPQLMVRGKAIKYDELTPFLRGEWKNNKELKVIVRADEAAQYQFIAPVLVSCAEANIRSVNFSVESSQ